MVRDAGEGIRVTRLHQQLLMIPPPAAGASILAHTAKAANNNTTLTTDAIDTTGAGALVAFARLGSAHTATLTDSAGNTWVHDGPIGAAYKFADIWHCVGPTTSASHTVTATYDSSMSTDGTDLYFVAVGGVTALDGTVQTDYKVTNSAPPWPISITTTASGIVITGLTILKAHYRPSFSLNSGWTLLDSPDRIDGNGKTSANAYQVTTAGTYNARWSPSDSAKDYYAVFAMAFK